jgi:hypothetical protein
MANAPQTHSQPMPNPIGYNNQIFVGPVNLIENPQLLPHDREPLAVRHHHHNPLSAETRQVSPHEPEHSVVKHHHHHNPPFPSREKGREGGTPQLQNHHLLFRANRSSSVLRIRCRKQGGRDRARHRHHQRRLQHLRTAQV